jgi:transcriptional regulator of acetoin/glycerol metabolism
VSNYDHDPLVDAVERQLDVGYDYRAARAQWELTYLNALLVRYRGNASAAARESGIERAQLHRLLRKHDIKPRRSP